MPTTAANFAMNPKSLLLIFAGMTLSFGMILAIMLAAVDTNAKRPTRRRVAQSRIQQETPVETRTEKRRPSTRKTRAARRPQSTTSPNAATPEQPTPTPTLASETLSSSPSAQQPAASAASQPANLAPNQAAMNQLGTLKQELGRELKALKKDRDAMLIALAQSLVALPAKEIALEVAALDDQSATFLLRQFSAEARNKVLRHLKAKRAQKLKKRLK